MYYSHFGLNQAPFKITPNTDFFFSGGNRGPILEALIYAITHGEGIIKVTGEVGSGKTMLCHMLPTRLPPHIETVYIASPSVSPEEILHAIAFELQLAVGRSAPRLEVVLALRDFLLKHHAEGKRVVVFVEESQSMPLATLEEIRLLSNLETRNDKLLQIVMFGQPELDDNLRQPNIRQLRERITHSFRLDPLTPAEIREYLMFRLRAAGYHGPDLFSNTVVRHIARTSLGLTRRVNLIADKALLAAFSENTHTIRPKHIEAAVRDSEFSQQTPRGVAPRQLWGAAALVAGGAVIGIAIYALLQHAGQGPVTAARVPSADRVGAAAVDPAPLLAAQPGPPPASAAVDAAREPSHPGPTPTPTPTSVAPQPAASLATAAAASGAGDSATQPIAPAVSGGNVSRGGKTDLIEARLAATREWLATEAHTTLSIQLMGASDPEQLRQHLNALSKYIEINKVFVYRTVAKQKPSLTVLYGSFSDRGAAREVLDKLPVSFIRANRPILRTVQGIRAEIKQHQTS